MVFRNTGAGTQAPMPTIMMFAAAYDRPPQRNWFVSCLDVLDKGRDGLLQVTATTRREPASQCETEPNARTAFLASALTRSSNSRLDRGRPTRQTAEPQDTEESCTRTFS